MTTTAGTTTITPETLVGDLVTDDPRRTRVLDRFGVDYCCGGRRTLGEVASAGDLDLDALISELDVAGESETPDWAAMAPADLARHIVESHHAYLWEEMPRVLALAEKVARVHGGRHPELADVEQLTTSLVAELEPHLTKEERILFPAIETFYATEGPVDFPFGRLANPIRMMLAEHDEAGEILAKLRQVSAGFVTPEDGCGSYTALYSGLEEMEKDLHLHIHKENNVLFPRVMQDEEDRLSSR
ncbi:iron-sulfur cluster repair di-iron protein [Mobilicoccus caccae]|uniref:Iron-sulfur cluster repair di-iron protein n=1 Tax=Mobilicoccus caccae TaxID=1859295 RepID=A0ABQ6IVC5_9MICO|nr:iron-sulfur cluster repair di-iron protein [Mobilicoccus caccae]GMA41576.1 iron-sulfur cluster repair di-iron protein [Mobilicoccus caccae]